MCMKGVGPDRAVDRRELCRDRIVCQCQPSIATGRRRRQLTEDQLFFSSSGIMEVRLFEGLFSAIVLKSIGSKTKAF